jgi:hypothetical protein
MEEELTESEEEVEEASDVEGDVGDELAVLPVRLHRDAHVDRVPHPAAATHPCHLLLPPPDGTRTSTHQLNCPLPRLLLASSVLEGQAGWLM